jgi:hypothetical protein
VDNKKTAYAPLKEFFEHISKLSETRATETVHTMTGLRNSKDDIGDIYLPTFMSLRGCYVDYLLCIGTQSHGLMMAITRWGLRKIR